MRICSLKCNFASEIRNKDTNKVSKRTNFCAKIRTACAVVPLPDGAVRLTDYPKHRADAEANRRSKQPLGVEASSEEESDKLRRNNALYF